MAPKSKGGQKFKKDHWTLQRPILKHPKSSFYVDFFAIKYDFNIII